MNESLKIAYDGRRAGKTLKVALRALAARARAAHEVRLFAERDRLCAEHDALWLKVYGADAE